ncbi:ATP-binding protein [Bifidobacterium eulemuris]|nr:ATP-binding protein [Bifidobacterium eulemuris]
MNDLIAWKSSPDRKPLLLRGARQVGKTWIATEFGRQEFGSVLRLDFMNDQSASSLFEGSLNPAQLIRKMEVLAGQTVETGRTLIVFDEVQECPRALTALKYFCEDAREQHIIATGSTMGVALHPGTSFPVGKVDMMTLHPLSFTEYLRNAGETKIVDAIETAALDDLEWISPLFSDMATSLLREYMLVGGMPEIVDRYLHDKDFTAARQRQLEILTAYDNDFSKHSDSPNTAERTRRTWQSLPAQLAKENRKFVYNLIRTGARAREYEFSLQWLTDYGIAHRVPCVNAMRKPLRAYEDAHAFKIYALDVGLMGAMAGIDASTVLSDDSLFTEFKGTLTEQYVCQQLIAQGFQPYYWANPDGRAEVDFVISSNGMILPIEVKAERNLRAKSLHVAVAKYDIPMSVRTSLAEYHREDWLTNVPLWAIGCVNRIRQ